MEPKLSDLRSKTPGRVAHAGREKLYDTAVKERIRNSVIASPSRSTRKRSQALVIPRTSLMRVMKEDLHLFPYRITTHQTLSDIAKEVRAVLPAAPYSVSTTTQEDVVSAGWGDPTDGSPNWLKVHFKKRVVSRKTSIGWSPYSPDLSPPDFLWGYLKDRMYKNKLRTLEQLKTNIVLEITGISKDLLKSFYQNFALRLKNIR
ncbi:hypothetical protein LOD99_6450 [Oopsacas minuta]|uniref:Uncharacterized protein n=1 Tax=Oopsacas minuta TaxID=111878 RepID=A0AAV7JND4_9METZ|nr:hypothetical protein LOD99_6450 [Oopsacas minuta]